MNELATHTFAQRSGSSNFVYSCNATVVSHEGQNRQLLLSKHARVVNEHEHMTQIHALRIVNFEEPNEKK